MTWGVMLGLHRLLPQTMNQFDNEVAHRYVSPGVRLTQKIFGIKDEEDLGLHNIPVEMPEEKHQQAKKSHADRVLERPSRLEIVRI